MLPHERRSQEGLFKATLASSSPLAANQQYSRRESNSRFGFRRAERELHPREQSDPGGTRTHIAQIKSLPLRQLSYWTKVRRVGLEPTTRGLRVPCYYQLSYRRINPGTAPVRGIVAFTPATSGSDAFPFRWPHYEKVRRSYALLLHCTGSRNRTHTKRFGSSCATTTLSRLAGS